MEDVGEAVGKRLLLENFNRNGGDVIGLAAFLREFNQAYLSPICY